MSQLKIAIVGAGPSGCMLARLLTQSSLYSSLFVTIFEGETGPNLRAQGGTLDLHPNDGLAAVKAANLLSQFEKYCRYDGENMIMCDKYFFKWVNDQGHEKDTKKSGGAPEIDRFRLRQILLESLPDGTVQWGKRLVDVVQNGVDDAYTLNFMDGSNSGGFDLVVGADGAWSKVRPLVSSAQPQSVGVGGFTFTVPQASKVAPETIKLMNGGNIFALHDQTFLSQMQMGDDYMQIIATWKLDDSDKDWQPKTKSGTVEFSRAKNIVLEKLATWDKRLTYALERTPSDSTLVQSWNYQHLPQGLKWEHRKGIVLIGDAAHLAPPDGEGVNQALLDSKLLAEAITSAVSSQQEESHDKLCNAVDSAVASFENTMFPRMERRLQSALTFNRLAYKQGVLYYHIEEALCNLFRDAMPLPMITMPIVSMLCHVYYGFIRLWYKPRP